MCSHVRSRLVCVGSQQCSRSDVWFVSEVTSRRKIGRIAHVCSVCSFFLFPIVPRRIYVSNGRAGGGGCQDNTVKLLELPRMNEAVSTVLLQPFYGFLKWTRIKGMPFFFSLWIFYIWLRIKYSFTTFCLPVHFWLLSTLIKLIND